MEMVPAEVLSMRGSNGSAFTIAWAFSLRSHVLELVVPVVGAQRPRCAFLPGDAQVVCARRFRLQRGIAQGAAAGKGPRSVVIDDVAEIGLRAAGLKRRWRAEGGAVGAPQRQGVIRPEKERDFRIQRIAHAGPVVLVTQRARDLQRVGERQPDLAVDGIDGIVGVEVRVADQERPAVLAGHGVVAEVQRLFPVLGAYGVAAPENGQIAADVGFNGRQLRSALRRSRPGKRADRR